MKLKLINIIDESPNVKSFFWKPLEKVNFIAGQYFYYTLPKLNYDDPRGPTRHFTLSNSPTEGNLLRLTTKFSQLSLGRSPTPMSGFKKTLLELKIGDEIDGRGPQGTFLQDIKSKDIKLLVAGGIGITPFRSLIKYLYDEELDLPYLIYSNSDQNFVFGDELKQMLGEKIELVNTGISGHIDQLKIAKFIARFAMQSNCKLKIENCRFSTVGPPKFVDSIEFELDKLGVDSGKIQSEKFTGY